MKKYLLLLVLGVSALLSACQTEPPVDRVSEIRAEHINHRNYYQVFVRSFADSNGDGVGDFIGLKNALPFLADLGIEGIWLLPIHPSPSYHGYDVEDFYAVNPEYGTMEDFEALLAEAQRLDMHIVIDFLINHSSSTHPWFEAFVAGEAPYDEFYRRIDASDPRAGTRGSWGQSIWHSLGDGTYYVGYFTGFMPDLNWSNPAVVEEMIRVADFWLDKGVHGLRLDAALHLLARNEVPANVPAFEETLFMLEYFEFRVKENHPDAYIVGEIWDSFSLYNEFYRSMDSVFHFDFGHLVVNTINNGFNRQYADRVMRWHESAQAQGENIIEAPFLRNHDQNRIASGSGPGTPNIGPHRRQLGLAAEMLLTVPGNPFIYYGEELGMRGEAAGAPPLWDATIRLPYLWGDERQANWLFDRWNYTDTYNRDVPNVAAQSEDPNALLNQYRRLLHLRKDHLSLRLGGMALYEDNHAGLQGFYRMFQAEGYEEVTLVLHNVTNESLVLNRLPEGVVIYATDDVEDLRAWSATMDIEARSTIIIQLSPEEAARFFE